MDTAAPQRKGRGALGTLGIIVEAAFKLAPLFKETRSFLIACNTPSEAGELAKGLRELGVTPVALQLVGGRFAVREGYAVALQLGGVREAVERQSRMVTSLCDSNGWPTTDEGENYWRHIRDGGRDSSSPATMIIKATCLPSDVVTLVEHMQRIREEGLSISCNMVNGVVYGYWLDNGISVDELERRVTAIRKAAAELNGHCVVEACPRELKEHIDVWGLDGPQLDLMKRIKEQFDPSGTLNPGRFVRGI